VVSNRKTSWHDHVKIVVSFRRGPRAFGFHENKNDCS